MLLLDINDAELVLTRDGETLYRQPGAAFVAPKATVLGDEALAKSRLHPQQSHNEFWQRLNADPVSPQGRGVANQADLVYLQLNEIRAVTGDKRPQLVIAAPAAATTEQLAILLGIADEAGFDVRAIVDASVAAASQQNWADSCRLVDISLQRASVTQLERAETEDGPVVRKTAVDEIPAAGFATLVEGWIDVVADRFVDGTRFDPLRIAETEQQVFDQLLAGIETGAAEFAIDVVHHDVTRRVSVSRHALAQKSTQRYELLARAIGGAGTLVTSHRVLRLPGLAAFLQDSGHDLLPLPVNAVAAAMAEHAPYIMPTPGESGSSSTGARLIVSLPGRGGDSSRGRTARPPTHLLGNALALPLQDEVRASDHPAYRPGTPHFRIRRGQRGTSVVPEAEAAISLNGIPIDFEHPIAAGDTIDCGGVAFQLIAVVDGKDDHQRGAQTDK